MKSLLCSTRVRSLAVWAGCLLAGAAWAQGNAVVATWADVHAGPSPDYPEVAQFEPGSTVMVYGCLADYSWCDVSLAGYRGWTYAGYLNFPYEGNYWPVLNYGTVTGFPIITFTVGPYWDHYYRRSPWYQDRDRWIGQPVMPRPPERRPPERRPPDMRLNLPPHDAAPPIRPAEPQVRPAEPPRGSAPMFAPRQEGAPRAPAPERVDRPRDDRRLDRPDRPNRRDDDRNRPDERGGY